MNISNIIEQLTTDAIKGLILYVGKKVFLNERAMKFYKRVWLMTQILFTALILISTLFLVSKSRLSNNTKLMIAIVVLFGVTILAYLMTNKQKTQKA